MKIAFTISGAVGPSTMTCSSAQTAARLSCIGQEVERSKSWQSSFSTSWKRANSSGSTTGRSGSMFAGSTATPSTACARARISGSSVSAPKGSYSSYQNIETPSYVGAGSSP
jgi:hypothetical protein